MIAVLRAADFVLAEASRGQSRYYFHYLKKLTGSASYFLFIFSTLSLIRSPHSPLAPAPLLPAPCAPPPRGPTPASAAGASSGLPRRHRKVAVSADLLLPFFQPRGTMVRWRSNPRDLALFPRSPPQISGPPTPCIPRSSLNLATNSCWAETRWYYSPVVRLSN